ncbi:hypothetical protein DPEC_G00230040 [Dallia pectoralis]|uniref:Uncharacterized protein n=1 Tax=Dallia pectoralis TaxID=75939 RepID=A0ACC2G1S9_DALPE|nr:hypothetical protein DPEC_G00230040 [Dallia pectoralis]
MLPTIQSRERYYILGNLNDDYGDEPIPPYVINDYDNLKQSQKVWRNRQRIILEVRSDQVYSVYITQHYPYRNEYDPANTYIITPNLLRRIMTIQTASASDIQEQWGINVSEREIQTDNGRIYVILRLLTSVIRDNNGICLMPKNPPKRRPRAVNDDDCDHLNIDLDLGTTDTGNARIQWSNIPQKYVAEGAMLALYKNSDTPLNYIEVTTDSGRYDTSTSLDAGMQARFMLTKPGEEKARTLPWSKYEDGVTENDELRK